MPTVDAGSHQMRASDRVHGATHPTSLVASSSSGAFVAGTNLLTVDAGSHQRIFASSSNVAFVAGTNLPTVDAGSHQ